MFANLKPYPAYRPHSDLEARGVPRGWRVQPMRSLLKRRAAKNAPELPLLSVARERGVFIRSVLDANHNAIPEDLSGYRIAMSGDLVINKMKAWQGSLGLAPCDGIVSPAYFVYDFGISNRHYGEYLLRSQPYVSQFAAASDGVRVGQWDLTISRLQAISVVMPTDAEQTDIVKFLGHAHLRIDRAVAAKRKMIALLEEQKQAVINHAVTRGLDPSAPCKESGVPWIGLIPTEWQVSTIGRLARVGNGSTPSRSDPLFWNEGHYPWLNSSQVNHGNITAADQFVTSEALARCHLPIVPAGSVLVAITGQGRTRGTAAALRIEATINQHLAYIIARPQLASTDYVHAVLSAAYLELRRLSDDSGSTKGALTCQDLKAFKIPVPPIDEQAHVIEHVRERVEGTARSVDRIAYEIELLKEFRTRLTADVVTGQLDVRAAAAKLPDLDPAELVPSDTDDSYDHDTVVEELLEEAAV